MLRWGKVGVILFSLSLSYLETSLPPQSWVYIIHPPIISRKYVTSGYLCLAPFPTGHCPAD